MSPWPGRLLALSLGFVLVVALEGALFLIPGLTPAPLVLFLARQHGKRLYTLNPAYPQRFFSRAIEQASGSGMRINPQPFVEPVDSLVFRVLFVGGSTVQGFPHPRRLTAASYLQAMLQDAWPHRQVEVFNAGITAVASFAVARTVEDAARLRPDLVVVYTGHNELYGVYGAASLRSGGGARWRKRLHYFLMQRRLSSTARVLLDRLPQPESPSGSLLEVMAAAGLVEPDDPRRQRALQNLKDSLQDIAAFCRSRQIPLVFCTLTSNERGFAPSWAEPPLATELRRNWQTALETGRLLLEAEEASAALAHFDQAAALHADHARLQFLRGQALERQGLATAARQAFLLARELDPRPWRASNAYNEMIRALAVQEGVLLADVEVAFRQASPAAGVGWELMADHLHPALPGQVLLARTLIQALQAAPPYARVLEEEISRLRPDAEYGRLLGDLPVEQLAVRRSMAALLSEPPMDQGNERQVARLLLEADSLWVRLSSIERQGVEQWLQGKGAELLALNVADWLFARQEFARAQEYYQAVRREEPYTIWGDIWPTLRWGRCLAVQQGALPVESGAQFEALIERIGFLAQAPDFEPGLHAFLRGYAYQLLDQSEAALPLLEEAVGDPGIRRTFFFDLLALLCEELIKAGRFDQAEEYVRQVTDEVGQRAYGRFLLEQVHAARRQAGRERGPRLPRRTP